MNDGGATSFRDVSDGLRARLPLRLVDAERRGPAHARNRGAELALGEFLAFTDDDCEVLPDWLSAFERGFAETGADALGGQTQNPYPDSAAAVAWQDYLDFICEFLCDEQDTRLLLPSNNVAYRRRAFEEAGGFDERFPLAAAEDYELGFRLVARGYRQAFWPEARIWHHHPLSPRGYLNMQFRYGRGEVPLRKALQGYDHPKIAKRRRRRFWLDLTRHLLVRNASLSTWALVMASQPAYHAGHVVEAIRSRRRIGVSDARRVGWTEP